MRISQTHLRTRGGSSITNSDGKFPTVRSISGLRNKCHRGRELEQNDYDRHNYIHRQNQLTDYSSGWGAPASSTSERLGNENATQHFIIQQIGPLSWHELIFPVQYIPVRGVLISRKERREKEREGRKKGKVKEEREKRKGTRMRDQGWYTAAKVRICCSISRPGISQNSTQLQLHRVKRAQGYTLGRLLNYLVDQEVY